MVRTGSITVYRSLVGVGETGKPYSTGSATVACLESTGTEDNKITNNYCLYTILQIYTEIHVSCYIYVLTLIRTYSIIPYTVPYAPYG